MYSCIGSVESCCCTMFETAFCRGLTSCLKDQLSGYRTVFSVILQIHVAVVGNPAAESFGQPLKHSDGCKRGLVTVDVFNIFLHIDKVYSSAFDLAKNSTG